MSKKYVVLNLFDTKAKAFLAAKLHPGDTEKKIMEELINYMDEKGFDLNFVRSHYLIFVRREK